MNKLSSDNKSLFDQLQLRQAELESSQLHAETLQSRNTELQFQLRESQDKVTLLTDELDDLRNEQEIRLFGAGPSAEEVQQIVGSVETKYQAKLSELRRTLATSEKERTESDANWSRKLMEKTKEAEGLRTLVQTSARSREVEEGLAESLRAVVEKLKDEIQLQQKRSSELQSLVDQTKSDKVGLRESRHGPWFTSLVSRLCKVVLRRPRIKWQKTKNSSQRAGPERHSCVHKSTYVTCTSQISPTLIDPPDAARRASQSAKLGCHTRATT